MQTRKLSNLTFAGMVIVFALITGLSTFLPQSDASSAIPAQAMPASKPVMALASAGLVLVGYGLLGTVGLILSRKINLPDLWCEAVSNRQRFLTPAIVGIVSGVVLILLDTIFSRLNGFGALPHPPFPTSVFASIAAGIGEEMIFRLFFISFWTWLIGRVILRGKGLVVVFWVVSVFSALAFGASHFPAVLYLFNLKSIADLPAALIAQIFLLNGIISIAAAYLFKRSGYLAAVGVHFWADFVWHVIWGLF